MKALLLFAITLHAATAIVESRGEARIQVPNHREVLLMDFRTASIEAWKVKKATLALHVKEGSQPKTILLSTIPSRWTEEDPSPAAKGLFQQSKRFPTKEMGEGWIGVEVAPEFVEAMAAGKSYGLAVEQEGFKLHGRGPAYFSFQFLVEGEPRP